MPNPPKMKIKLLYLMKLLLEKSDEKVHISTNEIINYLAEKDIIVERKTVISDIATLKEFGMDIEVSKSHDNGGYYCLSRDFELAEIKLIIEAILSSRFISVKKSKALISKLSMLVGPSERKELEREVFVSGRVKTDNESIYYNVDIIHSALIGNKEITFSYLEWNAQKELVPRKGGKCYRVSPWALTIKDEYYYLIAYDATVSIIKHYRVDKMKDIKPVSRSVRQGKNTFDVYNIGAYTNQIFGMFSGEEDTVTLTLPESKIGIVLDRFGKDIDVRRLKDGIVSCRVNVLVSRQFFGWLTGIGSDIKIVMPESVRNEYTEYLQEIINQNKN